LIRKNSFFSAIREVEPFLVRKRQGEEEGSQEQQIQNRGDSLSSRDSRENQGEKIQRDISSIKEEDMKAKAGEQKASKAITGRA
jgi:hypothetical protein